MTTLVHVFIFLFSAAVVWFFAGILIESVDRVAKHFHKTGFSVAFFVLGILTSISEISVAVNASLAGVPQISVGNLVGASFVVLLLIVPLLAIAGNGIDLKHTISKKNMILTLAVILLPVLLTLDGNVTKAEGILSILVYGSLVYAIHRQKNTIEEVEQIPAALLEKKHATLYDALKILGGGAAIFVAGHFLVDQASYFALLLDVPSSLMGLLLLSIGTNVPELVVAARSILKRHKDIAFGDYLGSAAANTLIFGFVAIVNGAFTVESTEFFETALLMFFGIVSLYFFSRSGNTISRKEGVALALFYVWFLATQIINVFRFSAN